MADQANASRADGVGALAGRLAALRASENGRIIGLTGSDEDIAEVAAAATGG